ncbi:MAG TPA: 3-hydroxyacyl-[acyl-carrier-protein] dehydratase FabZ [Nitrospiraceae bacterium]|nr:3-hydroxyacyl-[acyl-carrier-protein] dehydratase FabZ [Nitrospiraceae bacterium]
MSEGLRTYDIVEILKLLPHRYPFILVDRILEVVPGESIKAIKNVTINEPFFQGHFPGEPVMPGVLVMEGMAQAGAILAYLTDPEKIGKNLVYFAGMDGVRFRKIIIPGDQIRFELNIMKRKSKLFKIAGKAYVDEILAAEGELMATFS